MRKIKLYIHTVYNVFSFVKSECNKFRSSPCFHSLVKTLANSVRILEQVKSAKTLDCFLGFYLISSRILLDKQSSPFLPGSEGTGEYVLSEILQSFAPWRWGFFNVEISSPKVVFFRSFSVF